MQLLHKVRAVFVLTIVALVALPTACEAISGTMQIASKGQAVTAKPRWPRGLAAFLNSPRRTSGWNPFFSEMPNDCDYYEFDVRQTDEINELIQAFAHIKSPKLQICLSPDTGPRTIGRHPADADQRTLAVLFSIGDQETLDKWYVGFPPNKKELRALPPIAVPPTLTIFVQNPAVDLSRLNIPPHIKVAATFVAPNAIVDEPTREVIDRIERFQASRNRP
jgi:hypothetical protein